MTELTFHYASIADLHFLTTGKSTSSSRIILSLRKKKKKKVGYLLCSHILFILFLFFRIIRIVHDGSHNYKSNWIWTLLGFKSTDEVLRAFHQTKYIVYNYVYFSVKIGHFFFSHPQIMCYCDMMTKALLMTLRRD